jgi:2-polyprenyl-3-methyl-5-hydroxy-6-metoxy-1,4-benzoquinol methylase
MLEGHPVVGDRVQCEASTQVARWLAGDSAAEDHERWNEWPTARAAEDSMTSVEDRSNGWEAAAAHLIASREGSRIGVSTLREWARGLPTGSSILDLGCGSGVPVSETLMADGFQVFGVDASPSLVEAFRRCFPEATVACEAVESSAFFGRTFPGIVAIGLMFLLPAATQRNLIRRLTPVLTAGGQLLFTSPAQRCTWRDITTGRQSLSLGSDEYRALLSKTGLTMMRTYMDEGENHYYAAARL